MINAKINFNGRDEVLKILDTGGEIVKYLGEQNSLCPLINSQIKKENIIGGGVFGKVYSITSKSLGTKKYVVKQTIKKKDAPKDYQFKPCKIDEEEQFENMMYPEKSFTFPKGSYLCENEIFSEYVIGLLCSNLLKQGKSINFIDVISFATCKKDSIISEYILMERIDNNLFKLGECLFKRDGLNEDIKQLTFENILIQILHAMACYQTYKIEHGDLHTDNLMIEYIKEGNTFDGQDIYSAHWFMYTIGDVNLYIPFIPIIIKIGDFGQSIKYSIPMVGNKSEMKRGLGFTNGDILYTFAGLYYDNPGINNELFKNILSFMLEYPKETAIDNFINGDNDRHMKLVGKEKNYPYNLLQNKTIFGKYMEKPSSGKIVRLGIV